MAATMAENLVFFSWMAAVKPTFSHVGKAKFYAMLILNIMIKKQLIKK